MEATEGKPRADKRRRRLIVALVLVLVSMSLWWYWPRGDARFVGRWTMADLSKTPQEGELTIRSIGLAQWSVPGSTAASTFPWRFDGEYLVFGNEDTGPVAHAIQAVSAWIHELTSYEFAYGDGEDPYRVLSISPDEILLEDAQGHTRSVLRRIRD